MSENLARRAVVGVRFTMVSAVLSAAMQASILVLMARFVGPAAYGQVAAASMLAILTTGFALQCIERIMVVVDSDQVAVVEPALFVGVVALVAALVIEVLSRFSSLASPALAAIVLISHVVGALGSRARTALRKDFAFGTLALADLVGQGVGGAAIAIYLAYSGWGAFSIVIGGLAQAIISSSIACIIARKDVPWGISLRRTVSLVISARELAKSNALEILFAQAPTAIIAIFFDKASLGIFSRAYSIVQLPIQLITNSMSRVLISGFVAVGDDVARLKRGLFAMVEVSSSIVTPLVGGIIVARSELIVVVLGSKWVESIELVPQIAVFSWSLMTGYLYSTFTESRKLFADRVFNQFVALLVLAVAMCLGAQVGLAAAVCGLAFAAVVYLVLYARSAGRSVGVGYVDSLRPLLPGIAGGIAAAIGGSVARLLLKGHVAELALLIGEVAGCGTMLAIYYRIFHFELLKKLFFYAGLGRLVGGGKI